MPVRSQRRLAVLAPLVALAILAPVPAASAADTGAESRLVQLVNRSRANAGLRPLAVVGDLTTVARRHSRRMADQQRLHHNPGLRSETGNWEKVAENVGYGESADEIHAAFMGSSGHRANILDPAFTQIGVGVERRGDTLWVTEVFRRPAGSPSRPAPAPKPAPPPPPPAAGPQADTHTHTHTHAPPRPEPTPTPVSSPPPPPPPPEITLVVGLARIEAEDSGQSVGELVARAGLDDG